MKLTEHSDRIGLIPNAFIRPTKRRPRLKHHAGWLKFEMQFSVHHPDFLHTLARSFPHLSPCELHICAMLRESFSSWEIAEQLGITERSVENHRSNIRRKLGLRVPENLQTFLVGFN